MRLEGNVLRFEIDGEELGLTLSDEDVRKVEAIAAELGKPVGELSLGSLAPIEGIAEAGRKRPI